MAIAIMAGFLMLSFPVSGQRKDKRNLQNYDRQPLHYGFYLGLHSSSYKRQYAERFNTREMDSVLAINPANKAAFSAGFVVNFRIAQYADFRLLPEITLYENQVNYHTKNISPMQEIMESTFVDLPISIKYKSVRRGNTRLYLMTGIEPGIRATSAQSNGESDERLKLKGFNLSFQIGVGLDQYFQYFKFSPELRFSKGLINVLGNEQNFYSKGLKRLSTNQFSLYFNFE